MSIQSRSGLNSITWPMIIAIIVATVSLMFAACTQNANPISDLPELPADLARDLESARTAPVLMTKPTAPAASSVVPQSTGNPLEPTTNPPLPLIVGKACTAIYDGYVTFPITVCYPPFNLEGLELAAETLKTPPTSTFAVKFFKLSSHPKVQRVRPWLCSVRSGPWYAHVEGAQFCGANANIRSFKADILGASEPVVVVWSGAISDVPPPLNLFGLTESPEQCTCCSGVMCPNGDCKPKASQCDVMPPALK